MDLGIHVGEHRILRSELPPSVTLLLATCLATLGSSRKIQRGGDCERLQALEKSSCEIEVLMQVEQCEAIRREELSTSESTLKMTLMAIEATQGIRTVAIPQQVQDKLTQTLPMGLVSQAQIFETRDFGVWYSFIYKHRYVKWHSVSNLPVLQNVNVLVAGSNIFLSPDIAAESVALDEYVRAILQIYLYQELGVDGFVQVHTNSRSALVDYVDSTTAGICESIGCYE
ncbi:MAG: hypothetical protein AAF541_23465 [Pseudomonadota bacterium]